MSGIAVGRTISAILTLSPSATISISLAPSTPYSALTTTVTLSTSSVTTPCYTYRISSCSVFIAGSV